MLDNQSKIQELFRDSLLSDEEIYWLGAPLYNFWHLKGRYLFYLACFIFPSAFMALVSIFAYLNWFGLLACYALILSCLLQAGAIFLLAKFSEHDISQPVINGESSKGFYWWKPSYYAITNRRVLIFEQGTIRDYWYHLLDTPILKKPRNRAASIQLYSSTYAAKKKKTPVLDTLRGIPEDEADDAFAILKQAHEEALAERKQKMGME